MDIVLGTAQFGLDYGITNSKGKVPRNEVAAILKLAQESGIGVIDTAPAYGDAEKLLGELSAGSFNFITKTTPLVDINNVLEQFNDSLSNLQSQSVYALLIHNISDIDKKNFELLYQELIKLKLNGVVGKVGFSVYGPEDVIFLLNHFDFDIIQVPINVFDQRLISGGELNKLQSRGIEIHARSIFLQGLLLDSCESDYFSDYQDHLKNYFESIEKEGISKLVSALNFISSIDEIDKVVVGVTSSRELGEVLEASKEKDVGIAYSSFAVNDEKLINPSRWQL